MYGRPCRWRSRSAWLSARRPRRVTVEAGADLIESTPVSHTDVDRGLFDKLPLESQSSSLSSLVTLASPGISADSNGLFHGFGDHASNSFSVDGQPITDQQSKVFSNQLPVDAVESLEVIQGAPPGRVWRQNQRGDCGHYQVGTRRQRAARKRDGILWQLWKRQRGIRSRVRRQELGQFHFGERSEHGPVPGWSGAPDTPRSWQRRELLRPRRLQAFPGGQPQFQPWLYAIVVPDAEFLRYPNRVGLVRTGGRQRRVGPERAAGRIGGSALENQDIQHRPDLDPFAQPYHRADVRRLRAAGSIQLLSEPEPLRRLRAGISSRPASVKAGS